MKKRISFLLEIAILNNLYVDCENDRERFIHGEKEYNTVINKIYPKHLLYDDYRSVVLDGGYFHKITIDQMRTL